MSIEQSNTVDFIGEENATGTVVLTIADHLSWDREYEHLSMLQAKLNAYLAFVESGEIADKYSVEGKQIRIDIVGQFPLSEKAFDFLLKAQLEVEKAGFTLTWRQFEAGPVC